MKKETLREAAIRMLAQDPEVPTKTLARQLSNHPAYTSLDKAYALVRRLRGKAKGIEATVKRRSFFVPEADKSPDETTPVELDLNGNGGVISDIHMPYHSKQALETAIDYLIAKNRTDFLLINGDGVDCYHSSRFTRNPKMRDFQSELALWFDFLKSISPLFKRIVWKHGNHEARWRDYIYREAPALAGMKCLTWQSLIDAAEVKTELVQAGQIMYVGHYLTIVHGHEMAGGASSPVNPARGLYVKLATNAICGHHHRTSDNCKPDARQVVVSTSSLGCLCELRPAYMPVNDWNHGFAGLSVTGDDFEIENKRIINKRKVR